MATGAIASSGAWVPTLAVYQKHPTPTRNPQHRKDRVLGSQSLAVYICEVLGSSSLAVHLMKQGEEGRSKGARIRQGGTFQLPQSRSRQETRSRGAADASALSSMDIVTTVVQLPRRRSVLQEQQPGRAVK